MDLAGVRMLVALQEELGRRGMDLVVSNAHGRVRDLMRAEGLDQRIRGVARGNLLEGEVARATGASTPA
jgi:anti-anti-sigma regulatory factor